MNPRPITEADLAAHPDNQRAVFGPPAGDVLPGCVPAEVLRGPLNDTERAMVIRMPFKPDEIDLATLAHGGTVWLTIWGGGMPPVNLTVEQ